MIHKASGSGIYFGQRISFGTKFFGPAFVLLSPQNVCGYPLKINKQINVQQHCVARTIAHVIIEEIPSLFCCRCRTGHLPAFCGMQSVPEHKNCPLNPAEAGVLANGFPADSSLQAGELTPSSVHETIMSINQEFQLCS